ncbi:hypothetical protein [Novosphingobium album (ex Liu et al. 2023)]|uniref:DUF2502 domain-containing protein n=1 Tax=Novosphingobium album (ex Liu et al. 2023) TaxID=3031130 RepID=A0ABT5WLG4_9SPHN|nr:hypothetical protein [Novosphingobium album (ex Liu et al. 2023)]MDE8650870.1 hypothetical protein [Novosphingobium album (ex Liu et al. 2023)]
MNLFQKGILATTLAATALATTAPAMARDYRDNDNTAAVAIGAGVIGLALGAIIASSDDNDRDRYDNRYYVRDGWYYNNGQYYDRSGHRYDRNDWQRRYGNAGNRDHDRNWQRNDDRRADYGRDRDYYQRRGY